MHQILEQFNTGLPFPSVFPENFVKEFPHCDHFSFRNLDHFRHVVSKLTQKQDDNCNMSYQEALRKLIAGEGDFPEAEQMDIRDRVRKNLHRRGLITSEIYEAYRYTVDGKTVTVDVGKYSAGEPDCILSPAVDYIDFFYELYVSASYPYYVTNSQIRTTCARLLAAIEELERQHIYIKVAAVCPIRSPTANNNFFADIPLFSHKQPKDVNMMSAVVNDRLLRKFIFAMLEDFYDDRLRSSYGLAVDMKGALNLGKEFDEADWFESVVAAVGL